MDGITIRYGKIDPTAKADSMPSVNQNQPWGNVHDLRYDNISIEKNIGTFELNKFILDGEQEEMPDNPHAYDWGWWTVQASDHEGNFGDDAPGLDVSFSTPHSSNGITLSFYPFTNDFVTRARITWWNEYGAVLKSGIYENNGMEGAFGETVTLYTRVKIELLSTNIKHRYAKIYAIEFGRVRVFADGEIDYCNILEEIDPTSEFLSVNTMGFRIKTHNADFFQVLGDTQNDMLMTNQQMTVEYNGEPFGVFFLKKSRDVYNTDTVFDFDTQDAVGVMGGYQFYGGIYDEYPAIDLIQELFDICFPTKLIDFVLDDALKEKTVSGYIPIGTCRLALQYICFAIGAIADTSRRNYVWIYPLEQVLERRIPRENIYMGGNIETTEHFTSVIVVSHTYTPGEEIRTIYDDEIEAGEHVFHFTEPLHSLEISGGTILESSATYAKIQAPQNQHVLLTGISYIVSRIPYTVDSQLMPGEVERTKTYDGCTLVSQSGSKDLANHIFLYLNMRQRIEIPVRLEDLEVGYFTKVMTRGRPILGFTEQLSIQLRGRRATLRLLGNADTGIDLDLQGYKRLNTFVLGQDGDLI